MIGNDIVDLKAARRESNWQRPRWLKKLFTFGEQEYIQGADDPERMAWVLWSMKEAAYKAALRLGAKRTFAPRRLASEVFDRSCDRFQGCIRFEQYTFPTITLCTSEYVYTRTASSENPAWLRQTVLPLSQTLSARPIIYQAVIESYSRAIHSSGVDLRIKKDSQGIPHIFHQNVQQTALLSISHHGRFGAFCILES